MRNGHGDRRYIACEKSRRVIMLHGPSYHVAIRRTCRWRTRKLTPLWGLESFFQRSFLQYGYGYARGGVRGNTHTRRAERALCIARRRNCGQRRGNAKALPRCAGRAERTFGSGNRNELKEGFFTARGGCRVGVCGQMYTKNGLCERLWQISGFNIRIARQIKGCADK